jgi:hypothetical protein
MPKFLSLLLIAATLPAATIVVPNGYDNTPGNFPNAFPLDIADVCNGCPGSNGSQRYQQVYDASQFPQGPIQITSIAFRPDGTIGGAFLSVISDIKIDLSTTPMGINLSPTFADNVGSNDTTVFNGSLSLSSQFTQPDGPGTATAFDIVVPFLQPFVYDPSKGNLLIDISNFVGALTTPIDAVAGTDMVGRVYTQNTDTAASPTASAADTAGLITQFTYTNVTANGFVTPQLTDQGSVPEPASLTLICAGLLALAAFGRYCKTRKVNMRGANSTEPFSS